MKYLNKSIYAFALVGMAGLWSCSQEDVLQGGDVTASGHPVPVTLTVNRGDAQTRTVLSENTATGGLNDVWEEGDKLAVYNSNGAKAGELVITDGVGEDTGVFTGVITSENGQYDFNLWYTDPVATGAKEADGKPLYFNSKNEMVVDLSKMPKYTTVEDLSAMDILSKKVKLNIKDNNATLVQDEKMVAHLAMARFSLNGIPAGETGKLTIKNNGASTDGILYKQRLSLASSSNEGTVARPEGIVINDVNPGEDIYLAFIPQTYTLSFTFESEKDTYTFSFENPTELEGGVYYSAFTKEEGAEEGEFNGVNIPLVGTTGKIESDGKILGIKWAAVNDRSWIDCTPYEDDAYFFSYIPGIPLEDQDLEIQYPGDISQDSYIYHYQWGRNFGFIASDGSGASITSTPLPNQINLPYSWPTSNTYYGWNASVQLTESQSIGNPEILMCGYNDWSKTTLDSWPMYKFEDETTGESQVLSVAPAGFRLPTMDDFETLLPEGSSSHGVKYSSTNTFKIDGEDIKPFYVKHTSEGTTVVWTILKATSGQYFFALYEVIGTYELAAITKDIIENKTIDQIDFPAHGCRSANYTTSWGNTQCTSSWQYKNQEGWYWSNTVIQTNKANAGCFRFTISNGNSITFYLGAMAKKNALSVRCIYED